MLFEAQRRLLVDLCVQLSAKGYLAGTGGNIMMRMDDTHVLVTPSGTDYLSMSAADICALRLEDLSIVCGALAPSVETSMHAGILKCRPEVGCSIHTHQPVASACALIGEELRVPPEMHDRLGSIVPVIAYRPSGTSLLSGIVARAVRPNINAFLLKNHGVICIGKDSMSAVQALDQLEVLSRHHISHLIAVRKTRQPELSSALDRLLETLNQRAA